MFRFNINWLLIHLLPFALQSLAIQSDPVDPSDISTIAKEHSGRLSNAQRLARGLPHNRPKKRYQSPTTRSTGLKPRTSNVPTTAYKATAYYPSDPGNLLGFLQLNYPSGYITLITNEDDADWYYAPGNVPANAASLYTYVNGYNSNFYISDNQNANDAYKFTGYNPEVGSGNPVWTFSDFDKNNNIRLTYVSENKNGETYNMYLDSTSSKPVLYPGTSAASVNSVYGTTFTETQEVIITLTTHCLSACA